MTKRNSCLYIQKLTRRWKSTILFQRCPESQAYSAIELRPMVLSSTLNKRYLFPCSIRCWPTWVLAFDRHTLNCFQLFNLLPKNIAEKKSDALIEIINVLYTKYGELVGCKSEQRMKGEIFMWQEQLKNIESSSINVPQTIMEALAILVTTKSIPLSINFCEFSVLYQSVSPLLRERFLVWNAQKHGWECECLRLGWLDWHYCESTEILTFRSVKSLTVSLRVVWGSISLFK